MTSSSQAFLKEIETFIERRKMDATSFGRSVLNDPNFIFDLRAGRSPSMKTVDRVRDWMREQRQAA